MSLNYTGNLNSLFEFLGKDIARDDGSLSEDKTPASTWTYDTGAQTTVNTITYTSGSNNGGILTCVLKDSSAADYGFISFTSDRIAISGSEYLKETVVFTNGTNSFIKASAFYEDAGTGPVSAAGSAVYYVDSTCSCFAPIKRIKIIFNQNGTRDVRFYTNLKGDLDEPST